MREAVAELAIIAHIVIDARNRRRKALIRRADFIRTAAEIIAIYIGTPSI